MTLMQMPRRRHRTRRTTVWRRLLSDQRGQATLEWVLLVAVIAIPGYALIRLGLAVLAGYYQMGVTFTSLPGP